MFQETTIKDAIKDPHLLPGYMESRPGTGSSLQAMQASEIRYRRLFETAQDGIMILDAETGQIIDVNPYMVDMLHYTHEEFLGKELWEVSPFKDTIVNQAAFEELQSKGYIRYKDLPLQTKEGKSVAVEFISNVYKSNDNKIIQCNIRNITERKEVNQKLLEAVIFQQRLIDALPMPVFYMNAEGTYLGCNQSFEKYFGQSREQITGKLLFELFPKESADLHQEKKGALLLNPGIQIYETTIKDGGGVVHQVIFHKAIFPNADGSVGGLIGAILDITDRKQVEESLRVSEKQYRLVVENAKEAIFIAQGMKLVFANDATMAMTGYPEEILTAKAFTDFIHPDDLDMVVDRYKKRLRGGTVPPIYSFRIIARNGTILWCELNAAVIEWQGKPATLNFLSNITERKQAEDEIKQSFARMRKALSATVHAISTVVELKDPYTSGHQRRVADLSRSIAHEMGLPADQQDFIRTSATIHDIGKIAIPSEILSKPTKLTQLEFSLIKTHARAGYDILKDIDFPWAVADVVLQHHERMDGSGYPQGLTGNAILMEARILAVSDVVESMASHRPYRAALGIKVALEEIEKNKGIIYDDTVADACLKLFQEKGYDLPV